MKILDIRLKNLNSLRGTWHIDLDDKAYSSDGIFAVTGPTGAGKTTIFDAVCLALYSQTPRLGRVGGQSNEIMSRRTSECFAKVIFEADGKKYLCEWEQHRAKGKFQPAKHTITYADTGQALEAQDDQKQAVPAIVAGITGMNFAEFKQSVMLEQGGFDAFLKSGKNERATVLELITGTGIYGEISRRVFQRSKDETAALDAKRRELNEAETSNDGRTEEAVQGEISRVQGEISRLEEERKASEAFRAWHRDIRKLTQDLEQNTAAMSNHERRCENFEGDRKRLEASERSAVIEGDYVRLDERRTSLTKARGEFDALFAKTAKDEAELLRLSNAIPSLAEELSRLKGNADESPDAMVARIKAAVDDFDRQAQDVDETEKARVRSEREHQRAKAETSRIVSEGKMSSARKEKAEDDYRRIFDQIMSMRARTAEAVLEQERSRLIDGQPCPLCGSLEHPGITHHDTEGENADELFRETEKMEAALKKAQDALKAAETKLEADRERYRVAYAAEVSASQECSRLRDEVADKREKLGLFRVALNEAVKPLGISGDIRTVDIMKLAYEWLVGVRSLEESIRSNERTKSVLEAGIMAEKETLELRCRELDTLTAELDGLEASFSEALRTNGFSGEEEFTASRLNPSKAEELRARKRELDAQGNMLQGARASIIESLDAKKAMNLTQDSPEEVERRYNELEASIRRLHAEDALLGQAVRDIKAQKEKSERLRQEYEAQKAKAEDWAALNTLIGSAKGDKYRIFAQKITLGLVVNNANEYLRRMNGRYTLMLTPGSDELELSVKDKEQPGEIRPTDNLSGGERFIISLALALGLSQISGSRAKVDSLFLDEGFGSLDEEALNAALDALGEVRREGRMIGIISHVQGISDRIAKKIRVIPKTEGVSVLEGPGCSGKL